MLMIKKYKVILYRRKKKNWDEEMKKNWDEIKVVVSFY